MIISRGYHVELELQTGRVIVASRGAELLHDEKGAQWPSDSGLVMPFLHTGKPLRKRDITKEIVEHFGKEYVEQERVLRGRVDLPEKRLSSWKLVGPVKTASYIRRGDYHAPEGHEHNFGERRPMAIFGGREDLPRLFRRGTLLRIEGVVHWDWTGMHA